MKYMKRLWNLRKMIYAMVRYDAYIVVAINDDTNDKALHKASGTYEDVMRMTLSFAQGISEQIGGELFLDDVRSILMGPINEA